MRAIFLSYRRDDSEGEAGRLFDDLSSHFGETSVFMDVARIQVGRDFRKAIDESVATCGVLLAVIGKSWVDAKNGAGKKRLDDPLDFVRLETVSALKRDIPVVPVLVHGAEMPSADQLPDDLRDLAYRNACEISHARWNSDVQLLIKALTGYVEGPQVAANSSAKGAERGASVQPAPSPTPTESGRTSTSASAPAHTKTARGMIMAIALAVVAASGLAGYLHYPQKATVPDLTGSSSYEAARKLEAAHLLVGVKTNREVTDKKPNTVLNQSPRADLIVKRGTAVDLVMASRPAKVEVPTMSGLALDAAKKALSDEKLAVGNISTRVRTDIAPNTVIDEFPKSGRKVTLGTEVDLVVSVSPPKPVSVARRTVAADLPKVPMAAKYPHFGGVWQPLDTKYQPLTIDQEGDLVKFGNRVLRITPTGTVAYQSFYAHDEKFGHTVATAREADLVDTFTLKRVGDLLILETTFDYRSQYGNHAPGRDVRVLKYRR